MCVAYISALFVKRLPALKDQIILLISLNNLQIDTKTSSKFLSPVCQLHKQDSPVDW